MARPGRQRSSARARWSGKRIVRSREAAPLIAPKSQLAAPTWVVQCWPHGLKSIGLLPAGHNLLARPAVPESALGMRRAPVGPLVERFVALGRIGKDECRHLKQR